MTVKKEPGESPSTQLFQSKYDPEFARRVVELGREGKSLAQIAATFCVAARTMNRWSEAHAEFAEALDLAKTYAQAWWEDKGQAGITMGKRFNTAAWIFQMKNRFADDYRERQEVTGKDGAPLVPVLNVTYGTK